MGSTASADYPTTTGAFQTTYGGGLSDVFVTAIDPSKSNSLVYSTLLGGSGDDDAGEFARGVAVDTAGNVIVIGNTTSANFPTLHAPQSNVAGGQDAFVSKLNATGSALLYSTYLGGTGDDFGAGVVVDKVGNTFLTGQTTSANFPTNSAPHGTLNGPSDSFIAKLSADFNLSSSPASASITAGQTVTYSVTVSPTDGLYGLPVSLACTGTPSLSTCTISPQQVTPGSAAVSATVTITTTAPQSSMLHVLGSVTGVYALFLPLLWLYSGTAKHGRSAKLRTLGWVLGVVLLLIVVSLVGCGGSYSPPKQQKPGTPSGTSTITISGSSSSMNHTTTVTLNVI